MLINIFRLHRTILALFIITVVFLSLCAKKDPATLIRRTKPAVVTIMTFSITKSTSRFGFDSYEYNTLSQGSGFFINSRGDIITNYHVCNGADSAIIKTFDEKIFTVKGVISEDEESDIIMLTTDMPEGPSKFLQITSDLPSEGENVIVIGSPLGLEHTTSSGMVSSIRKTKNGKKLVQITAPISRGSSGGPVINMDGKVIGIASYQLVRGQNLNFAVSGEHINSLKIQEANNLPMWNAEKEIVKISRTKELIERGNALKVMGHPVIALLFYQKALLQAPGNARLFNTIATCLVYLERYDEAIDYCKEAIRIDNTCNIYYTVLARVFDKIGRIDDAVVYKKRAINANPKDCLIDYYNCYLNYIDLAILYRKMGHFVGAIKERKKAIAAYIRYNQEYFDEFFRPMGLRYPTLGK